MDCVWLHVRVCVSCACEWVQVYIYTKWTQFHWLYVAVYLPLRAKFHSVFPVQLFSSAHSHIKVQLEALTLIDFCYYALLLQCMVSTRRTTPTVSNLATTPPQLMGSFSNSLYCYYMHKSVSEGLRNRQGVGSTGLAFFLTAALLRMSSTTWQNARLSDHALVSMQATSEDCIL